MIHLSCHGYTRQYVPQPSAWATNCSQVVGGYGGRWLDSSAVSGHDDASRGFSMLGAASLCENGEGAESELSSMWVILPYGILLFDRSDVVGQSGIRTDVSGITIPSPTTEGKT